MLADAVWHRRGQKIKIDLSVSYAIYRRRSALRAIMTVIMQFIATGRTREYYYIIIL